MCRGWCCIRAFLSSRNFHARPVIAKKLVEIARKEGAVAICHGATGKGNDQIRFELGIKALAPDIKIIAPWRMTDLWTMQSREDEIEFCKAHGITLPFDANHSYSRDRNLWHISHEGLELEDPSQAPNYDDMLVLSVTPEKAPDKETEITMTFEQGVPKTLNGKAMKVSEIITELNKLGGENGIGIVDIVENRVVGMKSRGVYETPGGTILMAAHDQLEELILDRETMEAKKKLGSQFAQVVYEGKWYTPLREAIQAFVESTQKYVTGEVKFKLYKGNIIKNGTTSPYSLYNESLASFTTGDMYDHHDADGFITLFGLPLKVRAMKLAEVKNNQKSSNFSLKKTFPMFILYFVLAAIITTVSLHIGVNSNVFLPIKELSKFLIIMAMAAIGLNSNVIHLIKTGGKPLLVGASCWCGITIVSLLMQHVMGIW